MNVASLSLSADTPARRREGDGCGGGSVHECDVGGSKTGPKIQLSFSEAIPSTDSPLHSSIVVEKHLYVYCFFP